MVEVIDLVSSDSNGSEGEAMANAKVHTELHNPGAGSGTGQHGECLSEDEGTRLAMKLSLETDDSSPLDTQGHANFQEVRILDSEEEQIRQAIELSLQSVHSNPLDRKELADCFAVGLKDHQTLTGDENQNLASRKRKLAPLPFQASKKTKTTIEFLTNYIPSYQEPIFTTGAIKRTWASGFPREDDIKFEEVVQSSILKTAVLSSCQWDDDWLFSKVDCKKTKVSLVMDENEPRAPQMHQKHKYLAICGPESVSGIMHSKLMLLFYEHYARLVVPTGNLVPYDWGETGHMENLVFLIDLPYLSETVAKYPTTGGQAARSMITKEGPYTKFFDAVHVFCTLMNIKPPILEQLCRCDFTATKDLAFVFGAGRNLSDDHYRLASPYAGLSGLACQVTRLRLNCNGNIQVNMIASSIGNLTYDFVTALYSACQGSQATALELSGNSKKGSKDAAKTHMRIYFPSQHVVKASLGGTKGAGTIFLLQEYWQKPRFPRDMFFECNNVREGLLLHDKVGKIVPAPCIC